MIQSEDEISYIVAFNSIIAAILFCTFLCLRRIRRDSPTFLKEKNNYTSEVINNILPVTASYTIHSFFNFMIYSNDFFLLGTSNYDAFLYLYFLKKTYYLFSKMIPFSIAITLFKIYNIFDINDQENTFVNNIVTITFTVFSLLFLYFYIRDLYSKFSLFHEKKQTKSNAIILKYMKKSSLKETNKTVNALMKTLGVHERINVIPIPEKLVFLVKTNSEIENLTKKYYLKTHETMETVNRFVDEYYKSVDNVLVDTQDVIDINIRLVNLRIEMERKVSYYNSFLKRSSFEIYREEEKEDENVFNFHKELMNKYKDMFLFEEDELINDYSYYEKERVYCNNNNNNANKYNENVNVDMSSSHANTNKGELSESFIEKTQSNNNEGYNNNSSSNSDNNGDNGNIGNIREKHYKDSSKFSKDESKNIDINNINITTENSNANTNNDLIYVKSFNSNDNKILDRLIKKNSKFSNNSNISLVNQNNKKSFFIKQNNNFHHNKHLDRLKMLFIESDIIENKIQIKKNIQEFNKHLEDQNSIGVAFVIFKDSKDKNIVFEKRNLLDKINNTYLKKNDVKTIVIENARNGNNIIWQNLHSIGNYKNSRIIIFTILLLFISIKILTPAYIYSRFNPILIDLTEKWQFLLKLVLTYSYPLILSITNTVIIPLGVKIFTYFEFNWVKSEHELSLLYKNFATILLNTLITPLLANFSVHNFSFAQLQQEFIDYKLFIIQYIIQLSFVSNFVELLSLPETYKMLFSSSSKKSSILKKSFKEKFRFDYGYNYAFSLVIFLVVISFSILVPILPILGWFYFLVRYSIDKYNLCFIFSKEYDSSGKLSKNSLHIIICCILLMEFSCVIMINDSTAIIICICFFFVIDYYILTRTVLRKLSIKERISLSKFSEKDDDMKIKQENSGIEDSHFYSKSDICRCNVKSVSGKNLGGFNKHNCFDLINDYYNSNSNDQTKYIDKDQINKTNNIDAEVFNEASNKLDPAKSNNSMFISNKTFMKKNTFNIRGNNYANSRSIKEEEVDKEKNVVDKLIKDKDNQSDDSNKDNITPTTKRKQSYDKLNFYDQQEGFRNSEFFEMDLSWNFYVPSFLIPYSLSKKTKYSSIIKK